MTNLLAPRLKPSFYKVHSARNLALQIWRSDTAKCVYEQPGQAGSGLGGEAILLQLLPGGSGLMTATGDCRFVFLEPQVRRAVFK